MHVRVWGVIGPQNAGKSSTIGALVSQQGRGAGGARDVLLRGGGWFRLYAFRQSVQERGDSVERCIERFNALRGGASRGSNVGYLNLLIALRSDSISGLPEGDEYLLEFLKHGWEIASLALLGTGDALYERYGRLGVPTCAIDNAVDLAADSLHRNWLFGQVRNHFGWS